MSIYIQYSESIFANSVYVIARLMILHWTIDKGACLFLIELRQISLWISTGARAFIHKLLRKYHTRTLTATMM